MLDPDALFKAAGIGMALHVACSALLRSRIERGSSLSGELFGTPLLGDLVVSSWLLRGRYFLPWIGGPEELSAGPLLPRLLFWGARLGAMLLVGGFAVFLIIVFWNIGHP
jgi:hypothetical protein